MSRLTGTNLNQWRVKNLLKMKMHYWDKLIDSKHHELVDLYGYYVFYLGFFCPLSPTIMLLNLTIWVTQCVSYNKPHLLTYFEHLSSSSVFHQVCVADLFSFVCWVFPLLCFFYVLFPLLPVCEGCPFLIAPSGFSKVYLWTIFVKQCMPNSTF